MGKKLLFEQFCVSISFLLSTMLRKNEQNYVMGLQHCIGGDEEFQTHFLKFP